MRAWFLMFLMVGCSSSSETGSSSSHYCCTLREFCAACGCNAAETKIAESQEEASCKQLLESTDYRCALSDETTALSKCVGQTNSSSSSSSGGASRCVKWGDDGCFCQDKRSADDVPFTGTCSESGVGGRGLCCKGDDYCHCEQVKCGISPIDGKCLCGVGVSFSYEVSSCDGTAGTCCTQDTGYCYCEDGCQNRFANYTVSSCNQNTGAATCYEDETHVTSCQ